MKRAYRIRALVFVHEYFTGYYVAPLGMAPHIGTGWTLEADRAKIFKTKLAAEAVRDEIRNSVQRRKGDIIVETCYVPQEV